MALYLRLLGTDPDNPKIPIHQFQAVAAEWARGRITGAQANTIIGIASRSVDEPAPLTAPEVVEAQTLVSSVPVGTTSAIKADRALRLLEIEQILNLADILAPGYDTEAALKTKLGV